MSGLLYVFKGEGVAEGVPNRRPGARHALVVFARALDLDSAKNKASLLVEANGWSHVTFARGREVNVEPADVEEGYLRSALEEGIETGAAIISYLEELRPNA